MKPLLQVRRAKERAVVDRENAMVQADRKVKAAEVGNHEGVKGQGRLQPQ